MFSISWTIFDEPIVRGGKLRQILFQHPLTSADRFITYSGRRSSFPFRVMNSGTEHRCSRAEGGETRGQWPYRPASNERVITYMPMILNDINFLTIQKKKIKKIFCLQRGSNPGPLAPQSNTLTTEPCSLKQSGPFLFEVVSFCSVFGHFQPLTASEVTNNLGIELSDLNSI